MYIGTYLISLTERQQVRDSVGLYLLMMAILREGQGNDITEGQKHLRKSQLLFC